MTFSEFSLHESLQRAVTAAGFEEPTPIQARAIPVALAGNDLLGTAQTGTGKTAAFVLPLLQHLLSQQPTLRHTRTLVLTPTRELAEQVHAVFMELGKYTHLRSATVYGGVPMPAQSRALHNGTEIIVACPGRLLDHAARGGVDLRGIEHLVIDEADRMLDMGFLPDIRRILALLPKERQTMLFSATFPSELNRFVETTMRQPVRIAIGETAPPQTIDHALYPVPAALKTVLLIGLLRGNAFDSVLIFTRTKHRADRVVLALKRAGYSAGVLHANRTQGQRQVALDAFRAGKVPILVATDIAARGIDVLSISHVINYDIPESPDTYIHRIGRTGRATQNGEAFTLVTSEDFEIIRAIERLLGERLPTRMLDGFNYQQAGGADALPERNLSNNGRSGGRVHPGLAYLESAAYKETLAGTR